MASFCCFCNFIIFKSKTGFCRLYKGNNVPYKQRARFMSELFIYRQINDMSLGIDM